MMPTRRLPAPNRKALFAPYLVAPNSFGLAYVVGRRRWTSYKEALRPRQPTILADPGDAADPGTP